MKNLTTTVLASVSLIAAAAAPALAQDQNPVPNPAAGQTILGPMDRSAIGTTSLPTATPEPATTSTPNCYGNQCPTSPAPNPAAGQVNFGNLLGGITTRATGSAVFGGEHAHGNAQVATQGFEAMSFNGNAMNSLPANGAPVNAGSVNILFEGYREIVSTAQASTDRTNAPVTASSGSALGFLAEWGSALNDRVCPGQC